MTTRKNSPVWAAVRAASPRHPLLAAMPRGRHAREDLLELQAVVYAGIRDVLEPPPDATALAMFLSQRRMTSGPIEVFERLASDLLRIGLGAAPDSIQLIECDVLHHLAEDGIFVQFPGVGLPECQRRSAVGQYYFGANIPMVIPKPDTVGVTPSTTAFVRPAQSCHLGTNRNLFTTRLLSGKIQPVIGE